MPANLTDNYVANTYKGVLHVNGEELPADDKVQVYDGAGNETALKLGINSVDCLSLSAYGLTANDFKYPDVPGNKFSVLCQTSDSADGEINILELKNIKDVFCESDTGLASYSRAIESVVPIVSIECGIVQGVDDVEVTDITTAAGGITNNQTGNFIISNANILGGIIKNLALTPIELPSQPNLLINAQGIVNQRQARSGVSFNYGWNPRNYFLDRWKSIANNSITWSYNNSGNIATITAPANGVSQTIERVNIIPGSYILSWRGTAAAAILENGVSKASGNGGTGDVKTITANIAGDGNVEIRFTNGTFSLPKFERGSTRTEFDYRDIGSELILCQRYFCKTYGYEDMPGKNTSEGAIQSHSTEPVNATLHSNGWRFPVNLRAKQNAWVFNTSGTVNSFNFSTGRNQDSRSAVIERWADSGIATVRITSKNYLPGDVSRIYYTHYVADAEF
jgi:hypothetical protein